jgi:hypothetical protein
MKIDHIFIFSNQRQEADTLLEFGLTEGSGRTHPGVGTANRRFFFENFYLEILWVENEAEAKANNELGICERSKFQETAYSPFGLCLEHTPDTHPIFNSAYKFQPDFLPKGKEIEIITNEKLPWIFRFPPSREKKNISEPRLHEVGIRQLTKVTFNLKAKDFKDILVEIERKSAIVFEEARKDWLILEFDHGRQGKMKEFDDLLLELRY